MIVILVNSLQPASSPLDLDAEIQLQTAISKDAEGGRTGRARAVVFSSIPSLYAGKNASYRSNLSASGDFWVSCV